jgi:uncharacterized protein YkwD
MSRLVAWPVALLCLLPAPNVPSPTFCTAGLRAPAAIVTDDQRQAAPRVTPAAVEADLVRMLNAERVIRELPKLRIDGKLAEAARAHARVMAEHKAIAHAFRGEPELAARVAATGVRFSAVAENVSLTDAADVAVAAHKALMDSRPHRATILDPAFTAVGVGVVFDGRTFYIAQDFAHTFAALSPQDVSAAVLDGLQRARTEEKLAPLRLLRLLTLQEEACRPNATVRTLLDRFADSRCAFLFTTFDGTLPERIDAPARDQRLTRVAIEVCPGRASVGGECRVGAVFF